MNIIVLMPIVVIGFSGGAIWFSGCRDNGSAKDTDIQVEMGERGWTYRISDARTVSELRQNTGILTRTVALEGHGGGSFYHRPSCYCLGITSPGLTGDGEILVLPSQAVGQTVTAQLELPLVPKAGRHSISLVPIPPGPQEHPIHGHTLIWDFNIVEDVSVEPRIVNWPSDSAVKVKVTFRSGEREKVVLRTPKILETDHRIRMSEYRRLGAPFQQVGTCWAQEWICEFDFVGCQANKAPPTTIEVQMVGGTEAESVATNIFLDVRSKEIKYPHTIDLGNIRANETYTRNIRIGDPFEGPMFTITDIRCSSSELSSTVKNVTHCRSHWLALTISPTDVGPFESKMDVHSGTGDIFTIGVIGEVH